MPQRDSVKAYSPPWLSEGFAERYMYTFELASDALLEKMDQAMRAHLPGESLDASAIPYQAEDRLLVQGPAETNDAFTKRMQRFLDAWQHAGQRATILQQLKAYLSNLQPGVIATDPVLSIVGGRYDGGFTDATTWSVVSAGDGIDTPPTRRLAQPANWNWDGTDRPWRAWLIMFMHAVPTGISGTTAAVTTVGGSGVSGVTQGFATLDGLAAVPDDVVGQWLTVSGAASSGNNGFFQVVLRLSDTSVMIANTKPGVAGDANNGAIVWSLSAYPFLRPRQPWGAPTSLWGRGTWGLEWAGHDTQQTIASIRQILTRWKEAKTYYPNILVSFDGGDGTAGNQFSPLSGLGSGNPNGDYGDYGYNLNGVWVPRAPGHPRTMFLDGTGRYVRCNVHNVT